MKTLKDYTSHCLAAIGEAKNKIEALQKENFQKNLIKTPLFSGEKWHWENNGEEIDKQLSELLKKLNEIEVPTFNQFLM